MLKKTSLVLFFVLIAVTPYIAGQSESDEKAVGLVALAAVTNRSPYTRFSSAGGGQLEGFDQGEPGQYRVNQALAETALKYRGFSWHTSAYGSLGCLTSVPQLCYKQSKKEESL